MRVLLDTSAYAALRLGHAQIVDACNRSESVCLNAVVIGELLGGFRKGKLRRQNELALRGFLAESKTAALPVDAETAECYSTILDDLRKAGTAIGSNDVWIAASAMQYGLRLVTTDTDFANVARIAKDVFTV